LPFLFLPIWFVTDLTDACLGARLWFLHNVSAYPRFGDFSRLKGFAMSSSPVTATSRVLNSGLMNRIMSAEEAAALIHSGHQVGMSGFTGSGYPNDLPPKNSAKENWSSPVI
jgi:hypothetical protein